MSDPLDFISVRAFDAKLKAAFLRPPAWTRLEPQSISGDPSPGLEARVHDPLWLLCRQWQLGEFAGEDAGTPLLVHVKTRTLPVNAWQPGDAKAKRPPRAVDPDVPLDPGIEREPTPASRVGLRQRAEAGAYLLELLEDAGVDARDALVAACPLPVEPPVDDTLPPEQRVLPPGFEVIAAATPDGTAAAEQLEGAAPNPPDWLAGADAAALEAAQVWLTWFRANVVPANPDPDDDCWIPERLEHRFSVRVGSGADQFVLRAPLHEGREIDWFTFDHEPGAELAVADEPAPAAVEEAELNMIATPLRFAGMPADRYWQFEDGQVNLGRLDAQPHDLARLCVAEFAMVYGNDWLVVPLTIRAGSFTTIAEVAYTNSFGERIVVKPAQDAARKGRFNLYQISIQDQAGKTTPGLLVPPTALGTLEGRPLEEVVFLRDEMANMAWAVERVVQSHTGDPRSRGDEERPVNAVEELRAGTELQYLLQTQVPRHWIPFVPIATGIGTVALRKGTMSDADTSLGLLLKPTPLTIRDEEIPREGVRVKRVPALARGQDGRYLRWITRRVSVGRGEGWSGLAFDGAYKP